MVFATVLGINPMTVELTLRYLAKAGLVPQGLPGRRSAHYFAAHLKNLILALAAYLPSEAVKAVKALNTLSCRTNALANSLTSDKSAAVEKGILFGDWIVQEIEARVVRVEADYVDLTPKKEAYRVQREIRMVVNPPSAANWRPNNPDDVKGSTDWYHVDIFYEEGGQAVMAPRPVLSRQTNFTVELLIAAGSLLADTLAAQAATPIPDPAPGRAGEGDNAVPETMKAAGPGSHDGLLDTPATRTRRQRPLNKAQPNASQGRKQSCADDAVSELRGSYPPAAKDHHNGTLWTDAAPP